MPPTCTLEIILQLCRGLHCIGVTPAYLFLTLKFIMRYVQLLLHAVLFLWCYTIVWLSVCHICCLCIVHGGIVVFDILVLVFFLLLQMIFLLYIWEYNLFVLFVCFFIWINPWKWGCIIFHPWKFRDLFLIVVIRWVVHPCLGI